MAAPPSITAPSAPLAIVPVQQIPNSPEEDQALCATLAKKIKNHYGAIEDLRQEDRNRWREINKKLEKLEHVKSKKDHLKKGSGRKKAPKVERKTSSDVRSENKNEIAPKKQDNKKEDSVNEKEDEEDLKKKKDE
ncbi:unnamed protein product [Caenorhabditis angaria]|uniref:Uncharacterized protein n=1 Tax=Caenorhabditis angaria TaxID=860376 RepID=A0A9P1IXX9_9PELO|nr:unnamed protein product [Caenorhabditis angaria]